MGCFIVPATEAVVTTVVSKVTKKEQFKAQLKHLNGFLWGGSALLAFEHLWHGEIQPFFPFLTAASNPADASAMLHEMSTVGVGMAVLVTGFWAVTTLVASKLSKTEATKSAQKN